MQKLLPGFILAIPINEDDIEIYDDESQHQRENFFPHLAPANKEARRASKSGLADFIAPKDKRQN